MSAIFYLSSAPIQVGLPEVKHVDKVLHFVVFGALGVFYWISFTAYQHDKSYLKSVICTFIFGCSDEFHQSFVPSRTPDVLDIIADTSGAVFFVFVASCLYLYYMKRNCSSS